MYSLYVVWSIGYSALLLVAETLYHSFMYDVVRLFLKLAAGL